MRRDSAATLLVRRSRFKSNSGECAMEADEDVNVKEKKASAG
jgi:hypothetical protein